MLQPTASNITSVQTTGCTMHIVLICITKFQLKQGILLIDFLVFIYYLSLKLEIRRETSESHQ